MGFYTWLRMGGYAVFVWPAYGIAAAALGLLAAATIRRYRMAQRRLARLTAGRHGENA
jgi:heme exporter protein CcmD